MKCTSDYDDQSGVDFGSHGGPMYSGAAVPTGFDYLSHDQHEVVPSSPMGMSQEEFAPSGAPMSAAQYEMPVHQHNEEPLEEHEGIMIGEGMPPSHMDEYYGASGGMVQEKDLGEIHIPFEIEFQPKQLSEEGSNYVAWSVNSAFPEEFKSPGEADLGDGALLGAIELYDLTHDFGAPVAVQVSMKDASGTSGIVDPNDPDDAEGQRLFGLMMLGSHKPMPVHGIVAKGDKKELAVLAEPKTIAKSFLEKVNADLPAGAPMWNKSRLQSEGVVENTERRGTLLVANRNPVLGHINQRYAHAHERGVFGHAGDTHTVVSKELFDKHVHMIMAESAKNIKLGDVRNNLKIFITRNLPQRSPVASNVWVNPNRIFDHIGEELSEGAREKSRNRILNKKYSFSGTLALTYVPLKNSQMGTSGYVM
jgi:hypothetical protein